MQHPRIVNLLQGDADETWSTAYGTTGRVFRGGGIEAVWVSKEREEIDSSWFSQRTVDLLVVLQGKLRLEFDTDDVDHATLEPGQMLILPANAKCRAYRWPRHADEATIFLAVYPMDGVGGQG